MPIKNKGSNHLPQELKEHLHVLIDTIKDYGIYIIDKKGFILTWNRGAKSIKQYKSEEVIGKNFSMFYTEEAKKDKEPQKGLKRAIKNGYTEDEGWRVKKDGSLYWAHITTIPIFKNSEELMGFGKIVQDFTERKKTEELKDHFITVLSHELRTPVTCIRGALSLLMYGDRENLSEEDIKLLNIIKTNSERLASLITKTLDIEKIRSGQMIYRFQPVNLKSLVEEAIQLNTVFAVQYNRKIVCHHLLDVQVLGDSDLLIQVLMNLLSNAVKFSFEGTTIDVVMSQNKNYVTVAVKNSGQGIPENLKNEVFKRFFQVDISLDRKVEGVGLGLPISEAIIKKHQGTLTFKSVVNKETVFFIKLPIKN